jgi:hypothetical protein
MEKPYNAIPFYLLWGAALRIAHRQREIRNVAFTNCYDRLPLRSTS